MRGITYLGDIVSLIMTRNSYRFLTFLILIKKGVDDISFTPQCELDKFTLLPNADVVIAISDPTCPLQPQFRCNVSRRCLNMTSVCNFRYECGGADLSDEETCPWICNFDCINI